MTPEEIIKFFEAMGYSSVRKLPTGDWAGICKMAYTTGLFLGLNASGYRTRFCYEHMRDAIAALETWDGEGWPPGYWLKQKPEDIHGPGSQDRFAENKVTAVK